MEKLLKQNNFILMEAAIVERLRRNSGVTLHPQLVHAALIYDDQGRALNQKYGVKMLGGCCGTTGAHLRYLTQIPA